MIMDYVELRKRSKGKRELVKAVDDTAKPVKHGHTWEDTYYDTRAAAPAWLWCEASTPTR